MSIEFKTIGVIGRLRNPGVRETLITLLEFLQSLKLNIIVETETVQTLPANDFKTIDKDHLGSLCDLVIVVGGDGSLLSAAHSVVNDEVPVLGINRGSLGFLTDILPTELHKIKSILQGKYVLEKRFLLTAEIEHHGKVIGTDDALNEVALIPDSNPHMIEFEIYIDDQFVCSQNSDGLIIATPTGSTAYALSGGGPILHPQLDAMVLVPMFPHSLSARPIVIEADRRLKLFISHHNSTSPRLTCDAQDYMVAPAGCQITIYKKPQQLNLIHPLDYNYYETLRSKLHWGKKLTF